MGNLLRVNNVVKRLMNKNLDKPITIEYVFSEEEKDLYYKIGDIFLNIRVDIFGCSKDDVKTDIGEYTVYKKYKPIIHNYGTCGLYRNEINIHVKTLMYFDGIIGLFRIYAEEYTLDTMAVIPAIFIDTLNNNKLCDKGEIVDKYFDVYNPIIQSDIRRSMIEFLNEDIVKLNKQANSNYRKMNII